MMERARWGPHGERTVILGRHKFWTRERFSATLGKGVRGEWGDGRTPGVVGAIRAATFRVRAEWIIARVSFEAGTGELEGTHIAGGGGRPGAETRTGSGV